jgi:hypothetical protein
MKLSEDCTQLFLQYREIARIVWNLGFWPDLELREVACVLAYEEAMARLFEGMVLLRLGYGDRVPDWPAGLGKPVKFAVTVRTPGSPSTQLDVDRGLPNAGSHFWGDPVVQVEPDACQLRFMSFFDWNQLAPRDYRWLQVLIERFDERPELVGHLALVEFDKCTIWLSEEGEAAPVGVSNDL